MMRNRVIFYLNGNRREVDSTHAGMMLADYLRLEEALTGTKIVCAEGDCGACTVLRFFPFPKASPSPLYLPLNSCVTTVAQMDGSSLITVDALRQESSSQWTPVQEALLKCHGSQCGFCTPGFVMALSGLVEKKIHSSHPHSDQRLGTQEVKNALTGNLCRCTGYQPIIDAAQSIDLTRCSTLSDRFWTKAQQRELRVALSRSVEIRDEKFHFFAPRTLREAVSFLKKNPDARIIAGGSDLGVVHNKRKVRLRKLLSLHLIRELYSMKKSRAAGKTRVTVGARVTLSELRDFVKGVIPELTRFLDLFASPQIKNIATLVGNVGNASPIADTPPFLLVSDAKLTLIGPRGKRTVSIENFYKNYRTTELKAGEVITEISFEVPRKSESLSLYKVSQRKDLDISTINAAFRAKRSGSKISWMRIALGGVGPIPLRLFKTEKHFEGTEASPETIARAALILHSEISPISDLRGTSSLRRVLAENLLRRFLEERSTRGCPSE